MARPRFADMLNRNQNASIFSDNTRTAVVCGPEEQTANNLKRELVTSVEKPFTTLSKKLDRIEGLLGQINVKASTYKNNSNADMNDKNQPSIIQDYSHEETFSRASVLTRFFV